MPNFFEHMNRNFSSILKPAAEPPAAERMTLQQAAEMALQCQNACNISGVAMTFSDVLVRAIWPYALDNGKGTEWVNQNPICRMFLSKLVSLADYDDGPDFSAAYEACLKIAFPPTEPPAAEPPAAKCPLCGSTDMELVDGNGNDWECLDCGEFFIADYDDSDCSPSGPIG